MELDAAPDEERSDSDADSIEDGSWEEGHAEDEREPGIGGEEVLWGRSSVNKVCLVPACRATHLLELSMAIVASELFDVIRVIQTLSLSKAMSCSLLSRVGYYLPEQTSILPCLVLDKAVLG